jgi:hypothetical protein
MVVAALRQRRIAILFFETKNRPAKPGGFFRRKLNGGACRLIQIRGLRLADVRLAARYELNLRDKAVKRAGRDRIGAN